MRLYASGVLTNAATNSIRKQNCIRPRRSGRSAGVAGVAKQCAQSRAAELLRAAVGEQHISNTAMDLIRPGRRLRAGTERVPKGHGSNIAISAARNRTGQRTARRLTD